MNVGGLNVVDEVAVEVPASPSVKKLDSRVRRLLLPARVGAPVAEDMLIEGDVADWL